ncbi:hypothetical protein ACFSTI_11190 [Rhizorhabdus histidinilytica]
MIPRAPTASARPVSRSPVDRSSSAASQAGLALVGAPGSQLPTISTSDTNSPASAMRARTSGRPTPSASSASRSAAKIEMPANPAARAGASRSSRGTAWTVPAARMSCGAVIRRS